MPGFEFNDEEMLANRNDKSRPHFHIRTVQDHEQSDKVGHPVFRDLEYVKIFSPGNQREIPDFRVLPKHIRRWPDHYKAFKEGREVPLDGYPITEWNVITRAMSETLKAIHIRTLEELVTAPDDDLRTIGPAFINIKYKAEKFLKDHGSEQRQIDDLKGQNEELMKRLAVLEDRESRDKEPEPDPVVTAAKIVEIHDSAEPQQEVAAEPEPEPKPKEKPKSTAKAGVKK